MPKAPRKRETKKLTCPHDGKVVKFTIPKIERACTIRLPASGRAAESL
jgi:hypothetical protein